MCPPPTPVGCCIRSVAPWITVLSWHSIHKEGDILQIYFCAIFHETRHHAQTHIISGALSALSLAVRRTQMAKQRGWWFHWPVFAVAIFAEACCCCCCCSSHSSSEKQFSISLASAPDTRSWRQQWEFHCWLPPKVLFIFFRPFLDTHNRLPCLDYYVWLGTVAEM
jgi:hypothetical protein